METQRERRSLRYDFSKEELLELGRELSVKNQEVGLLEDQKKSVVSEYGSRINVAKEQVNMLSNRVSSGFEMRDVECDCEFHAPERGSKTLTRSDTGQSWTEKMTGSDWNLFTQYEQEQKKLEEEAKENEITDVDFEENESSQPAVDESTTKEPDLEEMKVKSGKRKKSKKSQEQIEMTEATAEVF